MTLLERIEALVGQVIAYDQNRNSINTSKKFTLANRRRREVLY